MPVYCVWVHGGEHECLSARVQRGSIGRWGNNNGQGVPVDTCPESIATHRVRWLLDAAHGVRRLSTNGATARIFSIKNFTFLTRKL